MRWLLFVLVAALLVFGVFSCGGDEQCDVGGTCAKTGTAWKACCTSTKCHYEVVGGPDFYCDGTDCNEAAGELVAYCNSSADAYFEALSLSEEMLKAVQ